MEYTTLHVLSRKLDASSASFHLDDAVQSIERQIKNGFLSFLFILTYYLNCQELLHEWKSSSFLQQECSDFLASSYNISHVSTSQMGFQENKACANQTTLLM
jgi:hypothetical protein